MTGYANSRPALSLVIGCLVTFCSIWQRSWLLSRFGVPLFLYPSNKTCPRWCSVAAITGAAIVLPVTVERFFAVSVSYGVIEIPGAVGSEFEHGIFDPRTRRVFIAHTSIAPSKSSTPMPGASSRRCRNSRALPERSWMTAKFLSPIAARRASPGDADTLKTKSVLKTGARPNGAAIVKRLSLGLPPASATKRNHRACKRSVSTMATGSSSTYPAGRVGA